MRRGHFAILFFIVFATTVLTVALKQYRNRVVTEERARLEDAFLNASDAAAEELALGMDADFESTLNNTSELFFESLIADLGLFDDEDGAMEANLYVPVLAVTVEDGFYLSILERVTEGGETLIKRRWTECMPFAFEDADFIYRFTTKDNVTVYDKNTLGQYRTSYSEVSSNPTLQAHFASSQVFSSEDSFIMYRQASIVSSMEKQINIALNRQAYLAGDLGTNIMYACPSFIDVIPEDAAGMFVALYQGLPSKAKASYTYSGVKAASFIREKKYYYVAEPVGGDYYRLAHNEGCIHLTGTEKAHIDRATAVRVYGAYGCPDCTLPVEGFMYPPN